MEQVTLNRETYDHLVEQAKTLEGFKSDSDVLKIYTQAGRTSVITKCSRENASALLVESYQKSIESLSATGASLRKRLEDAEAKADRNARKLVFLSSVSSSVLTGVLIFLFA